MRYILFSTVFSAMLLAYIFFPEIASAQQNADTITQIASQYAEKTRLWTSAFQGYARVLFRWLLIIDVCLMGIQGALGGDIKEILKKFTMLVFFAGFMLSVITYYPEWSRMVLRGMKSIALEVGGDGTSDSPFQVGLGIVRLIWEKMSGWSPAQSLGLAISGLIILVCFALITAQSLFIQCEAYITLTAGIILLGFGGASFTKSFATNFIKYAVSVAFKLFVLQLLIGVGISFLKGFETTKVEFQDIFVVIGASIVLLALVKGIPDVCAGIINGSHVGSGSALQSAASAVGGAAMGAVIGASAGAATASSASKLASLEGKTGIGRMASMAGHMWSARQEAKTSGEKQLGTRASDTMKERLTVARESENKK